MGNITQEEREFILQYGDAEEQRLEECCHYLERNLEAARREKQAYTNTWSKIRTWYTTQELPEEE